MGSMSGTPYPGPARVGAAVTKISLFSVLLATSRVQEESPTSFPGAGAIR